MQEWSPFMPLICMFSGEYRALQRSLSDSSQKEGFEPIRVRREGFQERPVRCFQPPCATPPLVEFLCPSTSGPFERTWNKDQPSSLYEGLYCHALEFRRLLKQEGESPQPTLVTLHSWWHFLCPQEGGTLESSPWVLWAPSPCKDCSDMLSWTKGTFL